MTRPRFRYPFTGDWWVTSPYGDRPGGFHPGVDFGLPSGTPVVAANDGTIIYAAFETEAGNTLTLSGADGWQSRYDHLQSFLTYVGAVVRAGDVIGVSDATGDVTGPHLHFEIRPTPTTTTDPIPILLADAGNPPDPDPIPNPHGEPTMTVWLCIDAGSSLAGAWVQSSAYTIVHLASVNDVKNAPGAAVVSGPLMRLIYDDVQACRRAAGIK